MNNQWQKPDCGNVRIKKATTLKSWIDKGWYQAQIDRGYIFARGCGRFRIEICECSSCRKKSQLKV